MTNELFIIVAPPICAAIGYLGKYFVDHIEKAKEGRKTRKLKAIENKLKNFFYPFFSNLKRENLIFQRILSFFKEKKNNDVYIKIFWGLDSEILNIHNENQELIKNNFIEMHFSNELAELIIKYDEYVSIYRILRKVIIDREQRLEEVLWPNDFGSSYPVNLLQEIEREMINLQNQQTYILQGNNIDNNYNFLKHFQYRQVTQNTENNTDLYNLNILKNKHTEINENIENNEKNIHNL